MENGSINYDPIRKRFRARYTDLKGKQRPLYAKTEKEVLEKLHKVQEDLRKNKYVEKNRITVEDVMDKFLNEQEASKELKAGSMLRKRKTAELISQMKLSKKPIQNVTAEQINEQLLQFVDPKGPYNYSQSYMNKIFSLLREVFKMAVVYEKLSNEANPFNIEGKIRKPRASKKTKKVTALNIEETKMLLQQLTVEEDKYKDVIWFLMLTGVRPGECLALKSKNCSLTENTIHLEVSLTKDSEDKTIIGEDGKTENAERTIFITPLLREIIETRINEQEPESLIFSDNGKIISVSTINRTF